MRRLAVLTGIFLATIGILAVALVASAAPADQPQGGVLRLMAGGGSGVITINEFTPDRIRVAEGTTVIWSNMGNGEPHTVTFLAGKERPFPIVPQPEDPTGRPPMLNPDMFFATIQRGPWDGASYVNLSLEGMGQEGTLTFGKSGTYQYLCLYHHPMTGTIEVVSAGSQGITTQADVDRAMATHPIDHLGIASQLITQRSVPDKILAPNGSTLWTVRAGTDIRYDHTDILSFLPKDITITEGDSIGWYVDHPQPHTITFPLPGQAPPDLFLAQLPDGTTVSPETLGPPPAPSATQPPDPSQMPRLVAGPGTQEVRPSPLYDGTAYFNSGFMGNFGDASVGANTWALTFTAPGTYQYLCLLHSEEGMTGTITVLPRG